MTPYLPSAVVVIPHRHGTCSADIGVSRQTKVIRIEEGKVKATEAVLLQSSATSWDAATCRLLDRLTFDSLARKRQSDRQLKQEEVMITKESKVKGTKVRFS